MGNQSIHYIKLFKLKTQLININSFFVQIIHLLPHRHHQTITYF